MNELQIFNNAEFGEVRTVVKDNEPWFVAADVCEFFGVTNRNRVLQNLDEDEKGGTQIDTPGGVQTVTIINEAGLYTLLFYLQPTKARGVSDEYIAARCEQLRKYKRWITHEVIPTIRKTGAYMTPETAMKIVSNPDFLIATANKIKQLQGDVAERDERITELEDQLTAAVEDNDKLSKRVMENGIKAWFADRVIDSGENMCIRETAKELGVKESDFTSMLVERKYLYRNKSNQNRLFPYSSPQCRGVFVVKEVQFKGGMTYQSQTLITPAGRIKLHAECIKAGLINEMPVQDSILWEFAEARS